MKQEFPKMLFRDGLVGGQSVVVQNEEEVAQRNAQGYFEPEQAEAVAEAKQRAADAENKAVAEAEAKRQAEEAKRAGATDAAKDAPPKDPQAGSENGPKPEAGKEAPLQSNKAGK